jgi:hypothetical protein
MGGVLSQYRGVCICAGCGEGAPAMPPGGFGFGRYPAGVALPAKRKIITSLEQRRAIMLRALMSC